MSINVTVSGTGVNVAVAAGIGPAGFIAAPGTSTNAFGTFQLVAGDGVTVSTAAGQFILSSYGTTALSSYAPVQSVQGRTGAVTILRADLTAAAEVHTHGTADITGLSAAASAAAPVQSVQGRVGAVTILRADLTAAAEVHAHGTADVTGFAAAAAAAAPVQSVAGRTGAVTLQAGDVSGLAAVATSGSYTSLSNVPSSFSPAAHTHGTADIASFTVAAAAASPVQSVAGRTGTVTLTPADVSGLAAVATSGSYTSLSNVPTSFTPAAHTHSTTDIASFAVSAAAAAPVQSVQGRTGTVTILRADLTAAAEVHTHSTGDITGYQGLPAQAGNLGPLVTDGTNASWTSRYSIVSPVIVQGDGVTITRNTTAGEITIAAAGGTSGITVGSATPQPLGTAAAGTSSNASREDHVHKLPTVTDITAAAAIHSHAAADVTAGTFDIARIPTIGYTALSGVPVTFAPDTAVANVASVNGITGQPVIVAGANVTITTAASSITVAAAAASGGVKLGLVLALT